MLGSESCSGNDDVSEDDEVAEESPLQRCLLAAKILLGRAAADNIFADKNGSLITSKLELEVEDKEEEVARGLFSKRASLWLRQNQKASQNKSKRKHGNAETNDLY